MRHRWLGSGEMVRYRWLAIGGLAILALSWALFVFTGSQAGYLLLLMAACTLAVALASARNSLVVVYLMGVLALVGPELSGQLGNGRPLLGSLRILDAAMVCAAAAALVSVYRRRRSVPIRWHPPGALMSLALAAIGYATLRWAMEGHRVDRFLRSDLRLIALAWMFWLVVSRSRLGGARTILWGILGVGALAAVKAAAIHFSGVYAIGPYDRLQASSYYEAGDLRTILVGGDTLLILVPAIAMVLGAGERRSALRVALALTGLASLWALGLSATRTSVLVALGVLLVAAIPSVANVGLRRRSRPALAGGAILVAVAAVVVMLGGATSRLAHADAPHVGLNFRKDEVNSFLSSSARTKYLGQGLAGRFVGKNVNGQPTLTGWAHELPVWIALKTGIVGLVLAGLALAAFSRRVFAAWKAESDRRYVLVSVVLVLGLVVMSMTLGRLALPDGILPLVVGMFLVSSVARPLDGSDV